MNLSETSLIPGSLRFGAAKLGAARFAATIEAWLAGFDVRPWPVEAGRRYAEVRVALERQGQPIGNMDLMIAAHALAEDSVLITNNAKEFRRVPRLAVEEWHMRLASGFPRP
ncbi:MAG: PIN domain-containing protein [Wenzhouxiangella sp.]